MAKHTEGPWELDRDEFVWILSDSTGQSIAEIELQASNEFDPDLRNICIEEGTANAHLLAAAPDLLAALKAYESLDAQRDACEDCAECLERAPEACGNCCPFAMLARDLRHAAIAKAEGR
jgi:hypothetical protein